METRTEYKTLDVNQQVIVSLPGTRHQYVGTIMDISTTGEYSIIYPVGNNGYPSMVIGTFDREHVQAYKGLTIEEACRRDGIPCPSGASVVDITSHVSSLPSAEVAR